MLLRLFSVGILCVASVVPAAVPASPDARYGVGSWSEKGLGNHRALVRVEERADAVRAHIPWRRRDRQPETKGVLVFDEATGKRVDDVVVVQVSRESGDIVFRPVTVPGTYAVYYLPYNPPGTGPFGTGGAYVAPETTAAADWVTKHGLGAGGREQGGWRSLPRCVLQEVQARNEFHRMDPMEVIATRRETEALLRRFPDSPVLLFPEDRRFPIRMFEDLPYRWINTGPGRPFEGAARPGEFYTFQIGVFAAGADVEELAVELGDLRAASGGCVPGRAIRCFNLGGTDWLGRAFERELRLAEGRIRPLWFGVNVPSDAAGRYEGEVVLRVSGLRPMSVRLVLDVSGPVLSDAGDSELWRHSRLRWLDSTLGREPELVPPYTAVVADGDSTRCLDRVVRFGAAGLPESVTSRGRELLTRPVSLTVDTPDAPIRWGRTRSRLVGSTAVEAVRAARTRSRALELGVHSRMEFDGALFYSVTLTARRDVRTTNTRLEVPLRESIATYMMGMSRRGGHRPKEWRWKWDEARADNSVWVGDVSGGLQLKLCEANEVWRLRDFKAGGLPESWCNGGKGGCDVIEDGDGVVIRAYTGPRRFAKGERLTLRFRFLITPFRRIDPEHWDWRYGDVQGAANIAHLHHGAGSNPHINYPFLTVDRLSEQVARVRSIRHKTVDHGCLSYPASGHIDLERGALHIWVRINFDPEAGEPGQARFNQSLFHLDFPNDDQIGFYWNIDDRGMRAYLRRGPAKQNRYPVLFGTHSPDWGAGQRHLLTLSWGERLDVLVDGKRLAGRDFRGTLGNSLEGAVLTFRGSGFPLDAVKITREPFRGGQTVRPVADADTLLLDTFAGWDGGAQTRPEVSGDGARGTLRGVCENLDGVHGPELFLSSRRVEAPPKGLNIYYTVRELSNYVHEMWALRSLGDEVFTTNGQSIYEAPDVLDELPEGYSWLREHLVAGYEARWRTALAGGEVDAAIGMQGLSRWHNYYVEGLAWLMARTGVDGLYLDGIGYDREIMKRVARVMHRADPRSRINFHSGDGWDPPWDPGRYMSAANTYMEHFPYISNLWFGELYDYSGPPDYWLVEVSGIPFGLTGEMLNYRTGGNPYRGMMYGMTSRQHPSKTDMWRLWDEFGIREAEMLGYWDPACPVSTDREDVLATVYRREGKALVALARWPGKWHRREAVVAPSAETPSIDGVLGEAEWADTAELTGFAVLGGKVKAGDQTDVHVAHAADSLVIGFRCAQSPGRPRATAAVRDAAVWEDDAVEVFVQPDIDERVYYQFVLNSIGTVADCRNMDLAWDGDVQYRARVEEGGWTGELRVPFETVGLASPVEGKTIGFNVCRDRQTPGTELSCWSPMRGDTFHDPRGFGRLRFASGSEPGVGAESRAAEKARETVVEVRLSVDWGALGLDPRVARLLAPPLAHFQDRAEFRPGQRIPIEPDKGWLLVME